MGMEGLLETRVRVWVTWSLHTALVHRLGSWFQRLGVRENGKHDWGSLLQIDLIACSHVITRRNWALCTIWRPDNGNLLAEKLAIDKWFHSKLFSQHLVLNTQQVVLSKWLFDQYFVACLTWHNIIQAPDWSRVIKWPGYWALIGPPVWHNSLCLGGGAPIQMLPGTQTCPDSTQPGPPVHRVLLELSLFRFITAQSSHLTICIRLALKPIRETFILLVDTSVEYINTKGQC